MTRRCPFLCVGGNELPSLHIRPCRRPSPLPISACAQVRTLLLKHGKSVVDQQLQLQRLANMAIDVYATMAVLARVRPRGGGGGGGEDSAMGGEVGTGHGCGLNPLAQSGGTRDWHAPLAPQSHGTTDWHAPSLGACCRPLRPSATAPPPFRTRSTSCSWPARPPRGRRCVPPTMTGKRTGEATHTSPLLSSPPPSGPHPVELCSAHCGARRQWRPRNGGHCKERAGGRPLPRRAPAARLRWRGQGARVHADAPCAALFRCSVSVRTRSTAQAEGVGENGAIFMWQCLDLHSLSTALALANPRLRLPPGRV